MCQNQNLMQNQTSCTTLSATSARITRYRTTYTSPWLNSCVDLQPAQHSFMPRAQWTAQDTSGQSVRELWLAQGNLGLQLHETLEFMGPK